MRIAVITPLFPLPGQIFRGRPIHQTAIALSRLATVEVFCAIARYPNLPFLRPASYSYVPPDPGYQPGGVTAHYTGYPTLPVVGRLWNGLACEASLYRPVSSFRPDLLLAYWLYPDGYAASRLARRLGRPFIVGSRGSDLRRISGAFVRARTLETIQSASALLTVSEELRQQALSLGARPEKVHTVLNGCDTDIFHPRPKSETRLALGLPVDGRLILYAGNLLATKGLRELLSAFLRLAPSHPDLSLAFVGQGPLQDELQRGAKEAGVAPRVLFPGPVSSPQVALWMAACDVFTLPSYSEGCPNVVLEALACGRPVVGSAIGGIPELLTPECGCLVPPRDPDKLAAALARALETPWDETRIAAIHKRSWSAVARETLAHCRQALSLSPAGAAPQDRGDYPL